MARRTKEWWAKFTPEERSTIVYFERYCERGGRSSYLPDDCGDCGVCGSVTKGSGACRDCTTEYLKILEKERPDESV